MSLEVAPLLLPRVRRLSHLVGLGALRPLRQRTIAPGGIPGAGHSPEAYRLRVDSSGVLIEGHSEAALRNGRTTLTQIERQYGPRPPGCIIEDWPAFPIRGVMLDISRDRVPTMEHLFEIVDQLAALKFNHFQLYTEHTFAYAGHEEVWAGASPITPAEMLALDKHCRERGIELAANQNCFGHLSSWLRHPKYAHLAETHGDWTFENAGREFNRSGPFSLCPSDPGSISLVRDLLSQLLACFQSTLVNIGCDETFDIGSGRSKVEVARRGRAAVYFGFVGQVVAAAAEHGRRSMMWADIALSHPESVQMIPEGAIGLAWGYEPDAAFGEWVSRLRDAGREAWVCPGTSCWRSITGRTTERRANILRAAREGAGAGATGYLVTVWGDMGHRQQWPISLHALAEAADAAWTGGAAGFDPRATSLHAFGDTALEAGPWLDSLGDADLELRLVGGPPAPDGSATPLRNASALFTALHRRPEDGPDPTPPAPWTAVTDRLASLHAEMPSGVSAQIRAEIDHTLTVAAWAALRARGLAGGHASRPSVLAGMGAAIIAEHRRLWAARSRPGGLDSSCRHYQDVVDLLLIGG